MTLSASCDCFFFFFCSFAESLINVLTGFNVYFYLELGNKFTKTFECCKNELPGLNEKPKCLDLTSERTQCCRLTTRGSALRIWLQDGQERFLLIVGMSGGVYKHQLSNGD